MPHIVVLYTANLEQPSKPGEPPADVTGLCRRLANALLSVNDEAGAKVFPVGGTRVFAMPAAHFAVADGSDPSHGFVYIQLRMGRGRTASVHQRTGQALAQAAQQHLAPLLAVRHFGVTLQVDEGPEVFDAKLGNLHAWFAKPTER